MTDKEKFIEILKNEAPLFDGSRPVGEIREEADSQNLMDIVHLGDHHLGFAFNRNTGRLAYIFNWQQ